MNASPDFILRLKNLFTNVLVVADNPLEEYCKEHYFQVTPFAYENKRKAFGQSYSVFLNELITPRSFEVQNFKGVNVKYSKNALEAARTVGDQVAKAFTWTDDKNLDSSGDYYLFPSEAIKLKKCDCEDHAFVVASTLPEVMGVAYGFWNHPNGVREGHAFNVFIHEGELYVLDTVGDFARIKKADRQTEYDIYFIITERYTFRVKSGVQFGKLAGWTK